MKTFKISQSFVTSVLVLGLLSYHCCNAETTLCDGTIYGKIIGDVECANDCVLYEATVTGNVTCTTGSLVAKGDSSIAGNVHVSGAVTRIVLVDVTVLGDVEVINAMSLTKLVLKKAATVKGSVSVRNTAGNIFVSGSIANLVVVDSGNLFASRLTTTNALGADHGISVLRGNGVVQISRSRVGGGLSVEEHDGDIKIYSTILRRGTNPGFIVVANNGDVKLFRALVNEVEVDRVRGNLVLYGVRINGNVNIDTVEGIILKKLIIVADFISITTVVNANVAVKDSFFNVKNDMIIDHRFSGNVTVEDSNFNVLGVWCIRNVDGNVTVKDSKFNGPGDFSIDSNVDGNVVVKDNEFNVDEVFKIVNNRVDNLIINNNTGGVVISENTIINLVCTNNMPPPDVSDSNTIGSSSGQC